MNQHTHSHQPISEPGIDERPESSSTAGSIRLVHIGDMHLYRVFAWPWQLLGKRLLGQVNLWVNRAKCFDRSLLASLLNHVRSLKPDLALFSGDLSTTALRAEFLDADELLAPLARETPCLVVPGNHDRYTFTSARRRTEESVLGSMVPRGFPHWQRLNGRWRLLALDAARPRLLSSRGLVGRSQLAAVEQQLDEMNTQDGLVVLCHYPCLTPPGIHMAWQHRLADAEELRRCLAKCRARVLYLHGHVHRSWLHRPTEPSLQHIMDVNAGSPTLVRPDHPCGQGFWQIDLAESPVQPIHLVHHQACQSADGLVWHAEPVL